MKQSSLIKEMIALLLFALLSVPVFGQTAVYTRTATIAPRAADQEGYGNLVSGDVTGSGAPQIYAVSGEYSYTTVPRIYEFKWDGTKWDSVWGSVPGLTNQNTWCPLITADLDGDGRKEIVWGPINGSPYSNGMIRLVDYEADGSGGDALGVPDGSGGYKPNATWNMLPDSASFASPNSRPFQWVAADVNNDGRQELIFTTRAGDYKFGVISVDNIPDNGDGSETWKMDTTGIEDSTFSPSYPDLAVIDSTIYIFSYSTGDMQPIYYANGKYTFGKVYPAVAPGGTWKTAQVVDLDNTGNKEIIVGSVSDGKVYLLQPAGDSLSTTEIADFTPLGCTRLNGSTVGDFNGDGYKDIAFGSRGGYCTPDGSIYMLYYKGGSITSMASYQTGLVDSALSYYDQYDMMTTDTLSGGYDQLVYSGIPRGSVAPIGVLQFYKNVDSLTTISAAVMDADHNFVPDDSGSTVKIIGIINSANDQGTNYCSYSMQDNNAGIKLFGSSSFGTSFNYGDRVMVQGQVIQYHGLNELSPTSVTLLDTARALFPMKMSLETLNQNPEPYENMLVELDGVGMAASSGAWPASATSNASMVIWDTYDSLDMYIDKDTQLGNYPAPTFPVNVQAVVSQYTNSVPANDGYEVKPSFYWQFTQNVPVNASPYFFFSPQLKQDAVNGLTISDSSEVDTVSWSPSIDLNGDPVTYQLSIYTSSDSVDVMDVLAENSGAATMALVKATDILQNVLKGQDTVGVYFTLTALSKGSTGSDLAVISIDTLQTMIINNIIATGIKSNTVPHTFFVDQNYPNPFNPTTTIRFGLQKQGAVNLIVYNILGQQVAILLHNQVMGAGSHEIRFDASNLASGTYIYRLQAGHNVVNKKMILLK